MECHSRVFFVAHLVFLVMLFCGSKELQQVLAEQLQVTDEQRFDAKVSTRLKKYVNRCLFGGSMEVCLYGSVFV